MAVAISATRAQALTAHLIGKTADTMAASVYMAAATATGIAGAEATYAGYARVQIHAADLNAAAVSGGIPQSTNANALAFPTPSSGTQTITSIQLFTASSGGTPFAYFDLPNSFTVNATTPLALQIGDLVITLPETNGLAEYACLKLLDHFLGKTAWTMPSGVTIDLLKTVWDGHTTPISTYLASYTSYAGVAMPAASWSTPTATEPSQALSAVDVTFPSNTGSAETEVGYILRDGSGNGLVYGTLSGTVNPGIAPKIPLSTSLASLG